MEPSEDLKYLWSKLVVLLGSVKFWVAVFAVLAAYGLGLKPELQGLIIVVVTTVFMGSKAYEDRVKVQADVELAKLKAQDNTEDAGG